MPEAPPFPFNSAGTLYMQPSQLPSLARPTRSSTNGIHPSQSRRSDPAGNSTINSSSPPPSKDSDSTNTSTDEPSQEQQQPDEEDSSASLDKPQPCSIADAPLILVNSDGQRDRPSRKKESSPRSKGEEQQSNNDNGEEGEKKENY